ncbi:hypothetical protein AMTRI_Chr03g147970 [Amborella trichopoda]|uniref:EF-hand domain-containing protein n=1 Tax=Amborella trichopoda TaxID=13333 RepID=W1NFH6_AMBTC|nr:uncharacterized protein LOC18421857 [Amborella trichopoda]ERM93959.1 hypothetical protein AMTR_s00264p00014380 [Amborella trichopoda]|eukprot:XP_006826722.1 uncharacterized protein LOC18421857 [Amborella trichopoda]
MADGGLTVLDGSQIRNSLTQLCNPFDSPISGFIFLEKATSQARTLLFGLSLPEHLTSIVGERVGLHDPDFLSLQLDPDQAFLKLRDYLQILADKLKDDPLVVSILDGGVLRLFLEDEDDFAMLAENIFTDLDLEDTGKLSKNEIQNALIQMGVEMGVPPFSDRMETDALLTSILKKHGAEGTEELGQAQFAHLLQAVLQDLADSLSSKPIVVIQDIKVINGSKLRKVLDDQKQLNEITESIFRDVTSKENGPPSIEKIRGYLERKGSELGLPPLEANPAVVLLYGQVFSGLDKDKSAELEREEFEGIVKGIFKAFVEELQANPVFHDLES